MATTLKSIYGSKIEITAEDGAAVDHTRPVVTIADRASSRVIDRAELIQTFEAVLDGTWINHADLPQVTPLTDGLFQCGTGRYHHDYDHRAEVMERLAVARHLEANPPVDETAVDALACLIRDAEEAEGVNGDELDYAANRALARNLIASGRVTVKDTDR